MQEFVREVQVQPAYDRRGQEEGGEAGAARLIFLLTGNAGAVSFHALTGWNLPSAEGHRRTAYGVEVAYHSPVALSPHDEFTQACPLLGGRGCWHDSDFLLPDEFFEVLVSQGHEALWARLEAFYCEHLVRPQPLEEL